MSLGRYEEAKSLCQETISLAKEFGGMQLDTLTCYSNLAMALTEQGKHKEGEELHQDLAPLYEDMFSKTHPETLAAIGNLTFAPMREGKYDEAEPVIRETLQLREEVLGENHPQTLVTLKPLATTLQAKKDLPASESLFRLHLTRCEVCFGPSDPHTLDSRKYLDRFLKYGGLPPVGGFLSPLDIPPLDYLLQGTKFYTVGSDGVQKLQREF